MLYSVLLLALASTAGALRVGEGPAPIASRRAPSPQCSIAVFGAILIGCVWMGLLYAFAKPMVWRKDPFKVSGLKRRPMVSSLLPLRSN